MLPLDGLLIVGLTAALYRAGPLLSTLMRLPSITVFLLAGVACRLVGLLDTQILHTAMPLHQAALAMITFAAGAELELAALRKNARVVCALTCCLTAAALVCVFALGMLMPALMAADEADGGAGYDGDGEPHHSR